MSEMDHATLWQHLNQDSPRARRAHRFAASVMALMRDFIPHDRECVRQIEECLLKVGYEGNVEIINVPPECDAMDKLQLERLRLETHPVYISADKVLGDRR